ncbi:MAG: hypothetical protein ACFFBD_12610 [Candidatus Hodarchaeota archaeon]
MKEGKFKRIGKSFYQKNILLTILTFIIGLTLQLADTTLILLVLGVAMVSTWWLWQSEPINVESKLILETLKKYPAVLIKNQTHIISFNSNPPCLVAVYQSPIPSSLLRRYLQKSANLIEGVEHNISQIGLEVFLVLKAPLTRYTQPKKIFKTFQSIIDLLELQLQARFNPAERYQILRLFGLEVYLPQAEGASLRSISHSLNKVSSQAQLISHKVVKTPVLIEN